MKTGTSSDFRDNWAIGYTRAVTEKRPLFAACLSSVITISNLTLLSLVLAWTENAGVMPIAAFAGGSWLGTYFTVRGR